MTNRGLWLVSVLLAAPGFACDLLGGRPHTCPQGGGSVLVPSNLSAAITSVTTDPPCVILSQPPYTGGSIYVNVDGGKTADCVVRAQLADGSHLTATLSFQHVDIDDCQLSDATATPALHR